MTNMTETQQAELVFTTRGFDPRPFSIRNIIGDSIQPIKPWVVAIGTSGGKTFTTAAKLEFLYKFGYLKKTDRTLIFAADKTILRDNFFGQFKGFFKATDKNPYGDASFTWKEVTNSKELKQAISDGINVIIMLPQTVTKRAIELLQEVKWEWFVQDEAHRWYFNNHITKILNKIKPTYQFLLTGTPFKFNLRKNKFQIDYTPVREMYEMGYLSDVTSQVLHSSVALNTIDYNQAWNLTKRLKKSETEEVLTLVLQQMVKKLKLPLKGYKSTHNISKNALSVFGKLQKTIIFTHGTTEANVVHKYLNNLGVKSIVSHSKIKGEVASETFKQFEDDDDVKILVAVNRAKEGFDFPELYNVIDMTYSQNFEVVMQIFGRVLRKNKNIPMKYFFKVAPKNLSSYFVNWMNAMFMLFDMDAYSKFNGKNGFDIQIPNSLVKPGKSRGKGSGGSTKGKIKPRNVEFFNSLSFMKENAWFKLDDKLATVASTTLHEVAKEFGLVTNKIWNFETINELINNSNTSNDFWENYTGSSILITKFGLWEKLEKLNVRLLKNRYSEEDVKNASLIYKKRTDLLESNAGLYKYGKKYNLLDKYFKNALKKWENIDDCIEYAKQFDYKNDLLLNNRSVWKRLKEESLLDTIFTEKKPNKTHSKSHLKKIHSLSKDACSIPIIQFDKNKNFIKEWKSSAEASKEVGITPQGINLALKGKNKTAAGFIWKYKDEYLDKSK